MIQHEASTPGGYVSEWLEEQGAEEDVLHIYADERRLDPGVYDLVVPLGSDEHAYDDTVPWLGRELELLRRARQAGVPTFGICFGGQLLARSLGGEVREAPAPEIGWCEVRTDDAALIPPGPWFQWHFDSLTPPPAAEVIADSPVGVQAFALGRTIGLQFHPEVTSEIVAMWADGSEELAREGVDGAALVRDTRAAEPQSRAAAFRLFDGLLSRLTADGNDRR